MNNVNVNKKNSIKLLKNYIQDLSFENPQNINENNSVNNNNIGFPGNELPVEINLKAYNLKDEKVNLTVKAKNNIVFQKVIEIEEEDFIKSVFFYVKSFKTGLNKFDISVSPTSFKSENNFSQLH